MAEEKREEEAYRKAALQRAREIKELADRSPGTAFRKEELLDTQDTKAEFTEVCDKVIKFVQPMHNWAPRVTRIFKVTNLKLEEKFERARAKAFGRHVEKKFHGTDDAGIEGITKNGFRLPTKPGMYGAGIYFATDSSKSAQRIYTKGSNKLLLCDVILGRSYEARVAKNYLNLKWLRDRQYDSVFAPRGTKRTGGVENDEFVVFDPDQAFPR